MVMSKVEKARAAKKVGRSLSPEGASVPPPPHRVVSPNGSRFAGGGGERA